jgi:hypothetical protein
LTIVLSDAIFSSVALARKQMAGGCICGVTRHPRLAILALALAMAAMQTHAQAAPLSPAEVAARRADMVKAMLTDAYTPELIQGMRRVCAVGGQPRSVAHDRGEGTYFTPDASDTCVAVLARTAHDGRLDGLYSAFLTEAHGDPAMAATLPDAIGAAVLSGATKVSIGNGEAAGVSPALAFDAGFTVAFRKGSTQNPANPSSAKLKAITEDCLAERGDDGTCFSVGYAYGAEAVLTR